MKLGKVNSPAVFVKRMTDYSEFYGSFMLRISKGDLYAVLDSAGKLPGDAEVCC